METLNISEIIEPTEPSRPVSAAPVQQKERILILDLLRGIAICGILIMNIHFFGRSFWADDLRVFHEGREPGGSGIFLASSPLFWSY